MVALHPAVFPQANIAVSIRGGTPAKVNRWVTHKVVSSCSVEKRGWV